MNLYGFVNGDPISNADSFGLKVGPLGPGYEEAIAPLIQSILHVFFLVKRDKINAELDRLSKELKEVEDTFNKKLKLIDEYTSELNDPTKCVQPASKMWRRNEIERLSPQVLDAYNKMDPLREKIKTIKNDLSSIEGEISQIEEYFNPPLPPI